MLFHGGPWDGGAFYLENDDPPDLLWIRLRVGAFGDEPCCREWICVPSLCSTLPEQGSVGPYRRLLDEKVTKRRIGVKFANGQAIFKDMGQTTYVWSPSSSLQSV